MEMEVPRRSALDRLREPGLKKPRLTEEEELNQRSRATDREREDGEHMGRRGTSYHQLQELIALYKTALAELTFNSKPIITNLTIIAGENRHAAKAIAAAVCANVLEVPSEQKLPALYLLDSIVKNIGKEYIKYFAARLPEVFNKTYKQLDVSTHASMRHLFVTWKGVFPPSCLQLIREELGFPPEINGSSGGTTTRVDSQAQKPLHGIHVNPKYLEARQRLQQSTRGKEIKGEEIKEDDAPIDEVERSVRTPHAGNTKLWPELSNKTVQHLQKEQLHDFNHEKEGYKDSRGTGFSTQLSRKPDLEISKTIDQIEEPDELDKSYFGAGGTAESTAYIRNSFDANHAYVRYRDSESAAINNQLPSIHLNSLHRTNGLTAKIWKNSEEKYIWDDPDSRSADYKGVNNSIRSSWSIKEQDKPSTLQRRKWMSTGTEQLDSQWSKFDAFQPLTKDTELEEKVPLPRDHKEHYSQHHNRQDSDTVINKGVWPQHDTQLPTVEPNDISSRVSGQTGGRLTPLSWVLLSNESSALPWSGFQSSTLPSSISPSMSPSMDVLGSGGDLHLLSPAPSVPSVSSAPLQHQKPEGLIDKGYFPISSSQRGQKPCQLSGRFSRDSFTQVTRDCFPILPQDQQVCTSLKAQPSLPQASQPPSSPFTEFQEQMPSFQQSQPDMSTQASQNEMAVPLSQGYKANHSKGFSSAMHSNNPIDVSGQSNTSNLLTAIMKDGLLPNNPASGLQNLNIQPPLPSGPPPVQAFTSYVPLTTSSVEMSSSHGISPAFASPLLGGTLPPLPPGPPPSSQLGTSSKNNLASISLNPLSGLLSSLVSKGIIISTPTQLPHVTSSHMSKESLTQSSDHDGSTSTQPSSLKGLSVSEPSTPGIVSLVPSTKTKFDNLIGLHFKAEIVRECHPLVIDSLLDDLKYQCNECGLRLRHQEQLQSHLDWHKNSELNSIYKVCRRWYSSISSSGDFEPSCGPLTAISLEASPFEEHLEPMVAADESQSLCALCGEPFEDFYSVERDEWMFKGTIYLNLMDGKGVTRGMDESILQGPIVHAKCSSASADGDVANNS